MSDAEAPRSGPELWRWLQGLPGIGALPFPWPVATATRLGTHASTRRFLRLAPARPATPATVMLVLYDRDDAEAVARYERTATWLAEAGVRVPAVLASCSRAVLVEDGGDRLLAGEPEAEALTDLYRAATRIILALQEHGRHVEAPNPGWALDGKRLRDELEHTERHALRGWLEAPPTTRRGDAFDRLADAVATLPARLCHRDYHSRNLLVRGTDLMVLDFQDAMQGPLFYDLVSLLRDDYRRVPTRCAAAVLEIFHEAVAAPIAVSPVAEVPHEPGLLPPGARQAFHLSAAQRSLKALGTFGYQVGAGRHEYAVPARRTWRHARGSLAQLGWQELIADLSPFERL